MYTKTITYTDFNGDSRTEQFYFNLKKSELMDLMYSREGGLDVYLKRITEQADMKLLLAEFKSLALLSYGVRSDDGRRFIKSEELSREFLETEAYDEFMFGILKDADAATEFVNGILPAKLIEELNASSEPASE